MLDTRNRRARALFRSAALFIFLAIALGSIACAVSAAAVCSTWPQCIASPALSIDPSRAAHPETQRLGLIHQVVTAVGAVTALASGLVSLRLKEVHRVWVRTLPWVAAVGSLGLLVLTQSVLANTHHPKMVTALALGSGLVSMSAMVVATLALERTPFVHHPSPTGRWAWLSVAILIIMYTLGTFVAGISSLTRCVSWPVLAIVPIDVSPALQIVRLVLAIGATATIAISTVIARSEIRLARHGIASQIILIAISVLAVVLWCTHLSGLLGSLYSVLSVVLLFSQIALAVRADLVPAAAHDPIEEKAEESL